MEAKIVSFGPGSGRQIRVDCKLLYDLIFGKIEVNLAWLGRKPTVESLGDPQEDAEG